MRAGIQLWPIGALGLALLGACAAPSVQLQTVFGDARENNIAALDKYEGRTWRVSGTVGRVGLKSRSEVEAEFSRGVATARRVTRQVAYAVVTSGFGSGDSLVCFFEGREEAAKLQEGQDVTLEGAVYRISASGENVLVYMDECEVTK